MTKGRPDSSGRPFRALTRLRRPATLRAWGLYLLVLCLVSAQVYGGLLASPGDRVFAANDDSSLFIWWFGHAADAVASWFGLGSGQTTLLYTTLMNAPEGVNGAWNTSVLGIALPMVPVTWLAGPVVSYNLAMIAAPVVASLAAAVFLRRFTGRLAAFVGGATFGFSTYVVAQTGGHLNLAFVVFVPLTALLVSLLVAAPRGDTLLGPPRRLLTIGVALGLLVGWQLYVSSELLAGTLLATACLFLALLIVRPRAFLGALARSAAAAGVALVPALVVGAPLLVTMASAPGAPGRAIRDPGVWINDVLDVVVPAAATLMRYPTPELARARPLDPAEIGLYLGPVLLAVVIASAVAFRARPEVRVAGLTGLFVWILSLGYPLRVAGVSLAVPMPWQVVEALPLFNNILPMRLAVHVWLAVALLLAVLVDWIARTRAPELARRRLVAIAASVVALAMMAPAPVPARDVRIPDFYRGAVADYVAEGSLVATYPRPRALAEPNAAEAMVWQSVSGMRYRDTGGYFIGSAPGRPVLYDAVPDVLDQVLRESGDDLPRGDSSTGRRVAEDLREQGIDALLITNDIQYLDAPPEEFAIFVSGALGTQYQLVDGVFVVPVLDTEILERGAAAEQEGSR